MRKITYINILLFFASFWSVSFAQSTYSGNEIPDFNLLVKNNVTFKGGETEGTVALGGDLILEGTHNIAGNTPGNFKIDGDAQPTSLYIGGKLDLKNGSIRVLNNSFMKLGNSTGVNIHDKDQNNVTVNTRINKGNFDSNPRIELSTKQSETSIKSANITGFDFDKIFTKFELTSTCLSQLPASTNINIYNSTGCISLAEGQNVINTTGTVLNSLNALQFYNGKPSPDKVVVINVETSDSFTWNGFNFNGIGDYEGRFILFNFYNTKSLELSQNAQTIKGSIFAPKADFNKNNNSNIDGQVVVKSFIMKGGELHHQPFVKIETCYTLPKQFCEDKDISVYHGSGFNTTLNAATKNNDGTYTIELLVESKSYCQDLKHYSVEVDDNNNVSNIQWSVVSGNVTGQLVNSTTNTDGFKGFRIANITGMNKKEASFKITYTLNYLQNQKLLARVYHTAYNYNTRRYYYYYRNKIAEFSIFNYNTKINCSGDNIVDNEIRLDNNQECKLKRAYGSNHNHAMWLYDYNDDFSEATYKFKDDSGKITRYSNATARLRGTLVNIKDANDTWELEMNLSAGKKWEDWSALGRNYKDERGFADENYKDWVYYEMSPDSGSRLVRQINNGEDEEIIKLTHAPGDLNYGFQLGTAANNKNGNYGISGWFFYQKDENGPKIQGDINMDVEDCTDIDLKDTDGDTVPDVIDNCVDNPNLDQLDQDNDGIGDECDENCQPFEDNTEYKLTNNITSTGIIYFQGVTNSIDITMKWYRDSKDEGRLLLRRQGSIIKVLEMDDVSEIDGVTHTVNIYSEQEFDAVEFTTDNSQAYYILKIRAHLNSCNKDKDEDGIPDGIDNCPNTHNPDQLDTDKDGIGDVCDDSNTPIVTNCVAKEFAPRGEIHVIGFDILIGPGTLVKRYILDDNGGTFTFTNDGTASLKGVVHPKDNPSDKWELEFHFTAGKNWLEWSALGRNYKDEAGLAKDNYLDWTYYELDTENAANMIGLEDNLGDEIEFTHRPQSYEYGFQLGHAANNRRSSYGFSGWFKYRKKGSDNEWDNGDIHITLADCVASNDIDSDGVFNGQDNCPETYNPNQEDADNDGIGDVCDDTYDGVVSVRNQKIMLPESVKSYEIYQTSGAGQKNEGIQKGIYFLKTVDENGTQNMKKVYVRGE